MSNSPSFLIRLIGALKPYRLLHRARIQVDKLRGLDFLTTTYQEEVGLDPTIATRSSPSGDKYLERVMRALDITSKDRILDIGCGKGSAIRTMLKYPFGRVDGVELAGQLAAIAVKNLSTLKTNRSTIYTEDASVFSGYSGYNFVYFYNPFPCEIMAKVIDKLIRSISGAKAEVIIIYNNPACHNEIVRQHVFTKIGEYPNKWGNAIYVYSNMDITSSRMKDAFQSGSPRW